MTDAVPRTVFSYRENAIRVRSRHYRDEAARFRSLAEVEPLVQMKRHLTRLARQYAELEAIDPLTASDRRGADGVAGRRRQG